jgi:AraC-like DNA-binding protein
MPTLSVERRLRVWGVIERRASNPLSGPLNINELGQYTGASERMLRDLCRAFSGHSPKECITRRRMNIARAMLERGCPQQVTVASIATFCGFLHLSRFAMAFRDRYGEYPSLTIRRAPGMVRQSDE